MTVIIDTEEFPEYLPEGFSELSAEKQLLEAQGLFEEDPGNFIEELPDFNTVTTKPA